MLLTISHEQARILFLENALPKSVQIMLNVDDSEQAFLEQLRTEHAISHLQKMRGSLKSDWLSELLNDRQADRHLENL